MAAIYRVEIEPVSVAGEMFKKNETFELDETLAQSLLENKIVSFVKTVGKTPPKPIETVSQFAPTETTESAIAPDTIAEPKPIETLKPRAAK